MALMGYFDMLRGECKRAHAVLAAALRKERTNKYVQNSIRLPEEPGRILAHSTLFASPIGGGGNCWMCE
jgi:hypothetical protein